MLFDWAGSSSSGPAKTYGFPSPQVKALAAVVAEEGDHIEEELRIKHKDDPLMW